MIRKDIKYTVNLASLFAEWWRYNVHLMAVCFDEEGKKTAMAHTSDTVHPVGHDDATRSKPSDYNENRTVSLETEPCCQIELYAYVVANTFPETKMIGECPDFDISIEVFADGAPVGERIYKVNQWGGATVVAQKIDSEGFKD